MTRHVKIINWDCQIFFAVYRPRAEVASTYTIILNE